MVTIEMVSVEHFEQLRLKIVPTKPDSMIIIFGIELGRNYGGFSSQAVQL